MTPEEILSHPARVLSSEQRRAYFADGYVHVEGVIPADWLARLRTAMAELIERSRALTESNDMAVLAPGHSAEQPRLRRIERLPDYHPVFWEFASRSILPELVADVVGPDVKYRDSMINIKWAGGGEAVKWHQDIPFYPHTNCNTIQSLLCLDDVGDDQGPLLVVPGSHEGPVFEHYDADGNWTGAISERDLAALPLDRAVALTGPAGSVTLLYSRTVHGSAANRSARSRPLLINGYSAADSFSYTPMTWGNSHTGEIVRGTPATHACHEDIRLRLPPDWSAGYSSIFEHHAGEKRRPAGAT